MSKSFKSLVLVLGFLASGDLSGTCENVTGVIQLLAVIDRGGLRVDSEGCG